MQLSLSLLLSSLSLLTITLLSLITCSLFTSLLIWLLSVPLLSVMHSCVVGYLCMVHWSMACILLVHGCFFSSCFKMSSSESVVVCFCNWSWRYCSDLMYFGFMCFLSLVTSHLVLCDVYVLWDLSWWLLSPSPSTVPWVHGLPSSHVELLQ